MGSVFNSIAIVFPLPAAGSPTHDENVDLLLGNRPLGIDFEATLGPYVEMCTKLGVIIDFDGTLSYLGNKISALVFLRKSSNYCKHN